MEEKLNLEEIEFIISSLQKEFGAIKSSREEMEKIFIEDKKLPGELKILKSIAPEAFKAAVASFREVNFVEDDKRLLILANLVTKLSLIKSTL